jgi:hypothetical protein
MSTVQQIAARLVRTAAEDLARSFAAMPADKQTWAPLEEGRCALMQVQENAVINAWFTAMLTDRVVPPLEESPFATERALDTSDKALTALAANTEKLVAAIGAFPDADLDQSLKMPWGETSTYEETLFGAYWNMVYHIGQIAYIQTLYGDKEMH